MSGRVTGSNTQTFGCVQRRTRLAFYESMKARMLDLIAAVSPVLSSACENIPCYAIFRRNGAEDWILKSKEQILRNLLDKKLVADAVRIDTTMFHGLTAAARMLYAGVNVDCLLRSRGQFDKS